MRKKSTALPMIRRLNRELFLKAFQEQFGDAGSFGAGGAQRVLAFVEQIEKDRNITDIRWAAYMLATTMWETTIQISVERTVTDGKGMVLLDKKKRPVTVKHRHWEHSMAPVDEVGHGKGRRYHQPVKIKALPDGGVRVTEYDGDRFMITPAGVISSLSRHAEMGTANKAVAAKAYQSNDGDEHVYFGRCYVQLTWWSNYAAAGIAIGQGLVLLRDPELVKDPAVAYEIMSVGMRTGKIFANGRSFADYFNDKTSNYKGARRMVNGQDHAEDIAEIALKFEEVLAAAWLAAATAAVVPAAPAAPAAKLP